ncbi:eCIS core domain-containing protein [Hymenobacter jejuensis]|uniref:DUF4157 domain-containing protein n=1 Tax=Hymenobacter jejuensis TaxID=2502781 RepID=A0A5B8A2R4_9BACT|nr:DUF4157 domain-containing protein [Hymenobacter jejuensis]QDA61590.1 DUF4157 domain-containing protein [Hymenobacter jejuensis]
MRITAEKLVKAAPAPSGMRTAQPFFEKAGRGEFFEPIRQATQTPTQNKILRKAAGLPDVLFETQATIPPKIDSGESVPEEIRRAAELRLQADFSMIRVHRDSESVGIIQPLRAQALVFQQHIFFGQGEYQPTSQAGKSVLVQALAHTLQQGVAGLKINELIRAETQLSPPDLLASTAAKPDTASGGPVITETTALAEKNAGARSAGQPGASPQATPETDGLQPGEAPVQRAPQTPQQDPEFGKVIGQTRQVKKAQKSHKNPQEKNTAVTESAHLPVADQKAYNDRKQHLEVINKTAVNNKDANKKFTAAQFRKLLQTQLNELEKKLPHSEDDSKQFKRDKPLEGIKNNVKQQVKDESKNVAAPITAETEKKAPPESNLPTQEPKPLVEEKAGANPRPIDAVAAAPKPKTDSEISMEKESQSLDELMEKNHNTEEQFAESNEPKFQQALKTKKEAQAKAGEAPQVYRVDEQKVIAGAQKTAHKDAVVDFGAMHAVRGQGLHTVYDKQSHHDKDDKEEQKRIKGELDAIYNKTKKDVDDIFTALGKYVEDTFETESKAAKDDFEKRVEDQLDDIHGWGVRDFLFGEDTEAIEKVFEREKKKFIDALDLTLNKIAQRIADDLNKAVECIQQGEAKAEGFYKGLNTKQQGLVSDAMETYRVQFANLESSVDEKQAELAHSLAESYKQNVDSLRKTFDKINEDVRKTWIQRAAEFIKEVALTIYRLGELLVTVLVRIAYVIGDIIAHPIRFLENLAAGIKQGFATFVENFDTYLLEGFFNWLKGKVGGAGIRIPAKLDTAGLFSIALQVIGLTYDNFREIAKNKLGEPVVAAIEKGVEGAEEVYKLIQMARTDIGAFWAHIKDVLANAVDEIFEKIKKTVLYETIKKVLAYIVTLFNPIGAFIKAAQAIYAGIRFLMDNIERIIALVNAFLDGVEMAVKGDVSGIASKVIFGLQNAIVMGIDFLAKLLGLGNLADKVRAIIKQLKSPVDRAMGFVVDKLLKPVVGLVQKAGKAVVGAGKKAASAVLGFFGIKKSFSTNTGETHSIYFEQRGEKPILKIESTPQDIKAFLEFYQSNYKLDSAKTTLLSMIWTHLSTYDGDYNDLRKVGADTEKAKPIHQRLLQKNEALTELLRTLLSGNRSIGLIIESYLLEGITGTYASMPRPRVDFLTPDHQPQAAILKWAADLQINRRKLFSSRSEMANRASGSHASGGYAINIHENRHKEGRTFGSKGADTLNDFVTFVTGKITNEPDEQKIRDIVVDRMKVELQRDVVAMRAVLRRSDVWEDINEITDITKAEKDKLKAGIKARTLDGLNQIQNQPMDNLKIK